MIVKCVAYSKGRKLDDIDVEAISDILQQPDTFVWVGLREPDRPLLNKIQEEFGLHELAIEDTLSAQQRPKLEEYGDSLFLVLRTAQFRQYTLLLGETHIFVGPRFLVTVRHGATLGYGKVRERCENLPNKLGKGTGFALYAVIDFIVDNYMPAVDGLRLRLDKLEEDIFRRRCTAQTLEQLYELKRELVNLRGAAAPIIDICNELMRYHDELIAKEIRVYYRDVHDHTKRILQAIDSMLEMLSTAMQVHLALVTVGQNEIVKRLAGWGAILGVPTMVFSLYGMNFHYMPELEWRYSYPLMLSLVAFACTWLYRKLARAGWL